MRLHYFIFSFLVFFFSFQSAAIERDLYFNNLSLEEGLNQSSIYSLTKDQFGFTWIGTQDGLHRFDGNAVELVPLSETELPKYRYIRDLHIIKDQLYVATTDGLVVIHLLTGKKSYPDVYGAVVYSVIAVEQQVWLGTNLGLIILNSSNNVIESLGKVSHTNKSFCNLKSVPKPCHSEIRTLVFDRFKQTVWLGTNIGLFEINLKEKYSHQDNKLDSYIHYHQVDATNLSGNAVRKLFIDRHHTLWIASYYGLHYLNIAPSIKQEKIQHIYHQPNRKNTLAGNRVLAIAEDTNGYLWVGTSNGLGRHNNITKTNANDFSNGWQNFQTNNRSVHSLTDNWIRSLLTDKEGRIWVGTNKGLSVTNTQRDKIEIYRGIENNAFNDYILSITEETTDKYWIGTQKGLYVFENKKAYLLPEMQKFTVYDTVITLNYIWVATRKGLFKLSLSNHEILEHYNIKNSHVGEDFIYKLVNIDKKLWVATTAGLHELNLVNNQWKSWYKKDGLVNSEIYTLYSSHDKLWIGTANGLSILDLKTHLFKNYSSQNSKLLSPWIFNIHYLKDNKYLIATDGGVYEFNAVEESFNYVGITKGNAYTLIKDDQNIVWITSNNGLYSFNLTTKEINKFEEKHGLASNEYNLNASLKNSQGELLFGTINGFFLYKPDTLRQNEEQSKARLITSLQIENKRYSLWDNVTVTNNKPIFLAKEFYFDWHGTQVELHLSNPYFALVPPAKNQDLITNVNLSNIKSGSYPIPLSLKKNNIIQVMKAPHPLLTWWAIIIYITLFSSLLTLFIHYRLMYKYNKEILANHEVIANKKDEIEKNLLFKQSLYLQMQHSFKSPVFASRGLSNQIKALLTNNVEIDKESIERKNNKLSSALDSISVLIDEFIVLTKNEPIKNTFTKQYVMEVIVKIESLMNDIASVKNVSLTFNYDNTVTGGDHIFASDKSLYLIIENVLANAIKFSKKMAA